MDQRFADEGIGKPMCAVWRVGDDVPGKRCFGFEEIMSALAIAVIGNVGGDDVVSSDFKLPRDRAVATSGFPDIAIKALDR